ncbi:MAG TPA: DsrE/DsrF/DrsH-like family protein [Candidatus Dormibacteraeota bacterium]|nr:DsrE/DsrF/DrsH-like family protein [Candidatus Dormibacteraeota bacterium]
MSAMTEAPAAKAPEQAKQTEKLVIILCSGDLDKVWAAMIIATSGAAMGKETSIFFTFWGFSALVKNDVRITGDNWMQKMLSLVNRPGDEHMKLSKMNFAGMGPAMLEHIADEHHAALPHELMATAKELGVRLLPCQMSMDLFGIKPDDLIDGVEAPVGAATMLSLAEGAITFFI